MEDILKPIEIMLKDKQDGIESVHDAVSNLIDKYELTLLEKQEMWNILSNRIKLGNKRSPIINGVRTKITIDICEEIIEELYEIKKHINDIS